MAIGDATNGDGANGDATDVSPISRFLLRKVSELARLTNLKAKRLKDLLCRRVKAHGSSYPLSGLNADLCASMNSIDANFFAMMCTYKLQLLFSCY
jgi:hypothetical protein